MASATAVVAETAAALVVTQKILTEWETALEKFQEGDRRKVGGGGGNVDTTTTPLRNTTEDPPENWRWIVLPTARQLYELGQCLHALKSTHPPHRASNHSSGNDDNNNTHYRDVQRTYHAYLQVLPHVYRQTLWESLTRALIGVITNDLTKRETDGTTSKTTTAAAAKDPPHETTRSAVLSALPSVVELYESSTLASAAVSECWSLERLVVLTEAFHYYCGSNANNSDQYTDATNAPSIENNNNNNIATLATLQLRQSILAIGRHYVTQSRDIEQFLPALELFQQQPPPPPLNKVVQTTNEAPVAMSFWDDLVSHLNVHNRQWSEILLRNFSDVAQREYLQSLLSSFTTTINTTGQQQQQQAPEQMEQSLLLKQAVQGVHTKKPREPQRSTTGTSAAAGSVTATTATEREIQRRIGQVRAILPDLGEGFVELALSCFQGSVEVTVAKLLDVELMWPATLQATDRCLPRRFDKTNRYSTTKLLEEQAKDVTKAALQASVQQEHEDAYRVNLVLQRAEDEEEEDDKKVAVVSNQHDEYNDDYDDQYDDMDGVGTADVGLYDDDDYHAVLAYNRVVKQAVAEQSFWQDNRNTNRSNHQNNNNNNKDGGTSETSAAATKYRGPDKMRGGRIPGRGRGGGGRGREEDLSGDKSRSSAAADTGASSSAAQPNPPVANNHNKKGDDGGKPNLRQKARRLDRRKEQQKKAQVKRTGA